MMPSVIELEQVDSGAGQTGARSRRAGAVVDFLRSGASDTRALCLGLREARALGDSVSKVILDNIDLGILSSAQSPAEAVVHCSDPLIRTIPCVMSPLECLYMIAVSRAALQPSMVLTHDGVTKMDPDFRISSTRSMSHNGDDEAEALILSRLRDSLGLMVSQTLEPQINRYRPGDMFRRHFDWIEPSENVPNPEKRVKTNVVLLNNNYAGGETSFPSQRLAVRGETGDVIQFVNADKTGTAKHPGSDHSGMKVEDGEKWILVLWETVESVT